MPASASRPILSAAFSASLILSLSLVGAGPAMAGDTRAPEIPFAGEIFTSGQTQLDHMIVLISAPLDSIEQTVTAGGSSLSYNAANDSYTYVWKTQKTWTGCRKLTFAFTDRSGQEAIFQLKP